MSTLPENLFPALLADYEQKLKYFIVASNNFSGSESPIELALYLALVHCSLTRNPPVLAVSLPGLDIARVRAMEGFLADASAAIVPQLQLGPHRVDFGAVIKCGSQERILVIECDGHDWHERTADQAAKDKARDRYMVEQGFAVLRFTGREIWRDALACARQIETIIENNWIEMETGSRPG